jgi:hypothetical protein
MNNQGNNLIFLISQPRSGSTLTQRMLGTHSQIHTQSEPWIMLHPLNALKSNNIQASYNMDLYIKGVHDFIGHLPGKETEYTDTISNSYQELYNSILKKNKKKFFLDKTPRYYLIINELVQHFPKARFVLLWRNPAAVLTSMVKTWSREDWFRLSEWHDDLIVAPEMLIKGRSLLGEKCFNLVYEDLINNPRKKLEELFQYLNIPFEQNIIHYGDTADPNWIFGDQETIRKKNQPDKTHQDQWISHLNDPQLWRVVDDYVKKLGNNIITQMGYSPEDILTTLDENKPNVDIQKRSLPLSALLSNNRDLLLENRRLKDKLLAADEGIKRREGVIAMKERSLSEMVDILNERNNLITKTNTELSQTKEKLIEQNTQISRTNTELSQTKEKLIEQKSIIIKTTAEHDQIKKCINKKNVEINELLKATERKDLIIKESTKTVNSLLENIKTIEIKLEETNKRFLNKSSESKMLTEQHAMLKAEFKKERQKAEELSQSLHLQKSESETQKRTINELIQLIKNIEKSYTFRIGTFLVWPARKIKNTFK